MTTRDPQDRSLLNESNAPTRYTQRSVGPFSLAAIWFAMAIQVAIFIAAGQLTASFQVWQVIVAIAAGCTIAVVVVFFTQSAAIRWGINFTVAARMPFGIRGSLIPIVVKALLSLFWFGFQTWLGALALDEITRILTGFSNLTLWVLNFRRCAGSDHLLRHQLHPMDEHLCRTGVAGHGCVHGLPDA